MQSRILQSLGVEIDAADAVVEIGLRWQWDPWGPVAAVLAAGLVAAAVWTYRGVGGGLEPWRRRLLTGLRVAWLLLLVALLLRPVLVATVERTVRRTLPVLVDTTESLALPDPGAPRRIDLVDASLTRGAGRAALVDLARELDVVVHRVGDGPLETIGGAEAWRPVEPAGRSTALGDALAEALVRHGGSPLAGIVLVSDGGHNRGAPVAEVAAALERASVPVFAIGVGSAEVRDVAVEEVAVRDVVLAEDAVPVDVRIRSRGARDSAGRVVVSLDGLDVAEETVRFTADDETRDVRLHFVPDRPGRHLLEARFEGEAGASDALPDNNAVEAAVRVVDRRLRILLVDQAPRWEYRFLEAMLGRERRVDLDCHLVEADPALARAPGSPHLGAFPDRREDLFAYDLVVLGDVDPVHLGHERQVLLREFVATAGGALVVVAGRRFTPSAYAHAELAGMLPVESSGDMPPETAEESLRPARLELTPAGEASPMMRLADDGEASAALWRSMPPVFWAARVARAKPSAEVLATRADPLDPGGLPVPVVVRHRYGAGEVLFVGTDGLWRWRRNAGDRHHATLWGQIVRHLAGARLLVEDPRVRLQTSGTTWRQGDRVAVHARFHTPSWEPLEQESIPATLRSLEDPERRTTIDLAAVPGRPGHFRADFVARDAGRFELVAGGADGEASIDLVVREDRAEFLEAAMNADLLSGLADRTGGAFFPLDAIGRLPSRVADRSAGSRVIVEADLWASLPMFALVVALATTEWIVRRLANLK